MSRRRRAILLLGLALLLGGLAASDVARQEAAVQRELGPTIPVVVAQANLKPGTVLSPGRLALRRLPAHYAPAGAYASVGDLVGARVAVAVPAGTDLVPALVTDTAAEDAPRLRAGERVVDLVATGSPGLVRAGGRVDVVITRDGVDGRPGRTELALEDAEVLAARAAPDGSTGDDAGARRVAVSLRVTLRQALALAEAQSFARELRVLPRAPGDHTGA